LLIELHRILQNRQRFQKSRIRRRELGHVR
jgi:hypothetical protein